MNRKRTGRESERGQILVLFTIAIVVVIAMLGLVLDGGSAFAQRRNQQNVADFAAIAGADAYINATSAKSAAADAAARAVATANGFTTGAHPGEVVDVSVTDGGFFATVTVTVTRPHNNNFATLVGMPTWGVSATASALASEKPNGALGAMPLLFNSAAFPNAICDEEQSADGCASKIATYQEPCAPDPFTGTCNAGTGNEDVPQDATQFNWTVFCTANGNACNASTQDVEDLIDGNGTSTVVSLNDQIGPLNSGSHTAIFENHLAQHVGEVFPVPIVCSLYTDPTCPYDGAMVGWAYFRLTSVEGNSEKVIKGYFVSPVNAEKLVVTQGGGTATLNTGTYVLRLSN